MIRPERGRPIRTVAHRYDAGRGGVAAAQVLAAAAETIRGLPGADDAERKLATALDEMAVAARESHERADHVAIFVEVYSW